MICMKKMPSRGSYGAADRTRTYYPIITNDVLYLMSYSGLQTLLWPYWLFTCASNSLVFQVILAATR